MKAARVPSGFTLIELMLVIGLAAIALGLTTINLIQPQTAATLDGTFTTLVTDLKTQQMRAMGGDSLSAGSAQPHGVYVQSDSYTLFKGTSYSPADPDNYVVQAGAGVTLSTLLPASQIVFAKGSGEVQGFSPGNNMITITSGGSSRLIIISPLGVLGVN